MGSISVLKQPKVPPGYASPQVEWAACATCEQRERTFALIRVLNRRGGELLCFDCYLQETGGRWRPRDLYWDGHVWIPLSKGE